MRPDLSSRSIEFIPISSAKSVTRRKKSRVATILGNSGKGEREGKEDKAELHARFRLMRQSDEDNTAWRRVLRREMVKRRSLLGEAMHTEFSARIVAYLREAVPPPKVVAFCWPIKYEPDIRAIIAAWTEVGTRAALPVVLAENTALGFREWNTDTPLEADCYGIPTPMTGAWLVPDLILLPLNGFDAAGYRLGYGGGYFDRTLAALLPRPLAIGVGFEINRLDSIRPESHDQRLDWIVTEAGAFRAVDA